MKMTRVLHVAVCALSLTASAPWATAATVNLSMNVIPTNLANPNGGGTWRIVAKTDSTQGICGISAYLHNVNVVGLDVENDIGHDLAVPEFAIISGTVNMVYGQDLLSAPLVGGVGTLSSSDGPDPFGVLAWDNATRIFSGTYSSIVPSFATNVGPKNNQTEANTFAQVVVGMEALRADTTTVVRVAVPEPATAGLAALAALGTLALGRRHSRG